MSIRAGRRFLTREQFAQAAKDAQPVDDVVLVRDAGESEPIVDEKADELAPIPWVFSTKAVDRHGDTVDPAGWKLENYKKNPVILFAHNSWALPIAKALNVRVDGDKLLGDVKFATKDEYELGDTVRRLVRGGYLRAGSVGFKPTKWVINEERHSDSWYGAVDFIEQELLEFSIVPIPANHEALAQAKAAGIELGPVAKWAERTLDEMNGAGSALRREIEAALKSLKPAAVFSFAKDGVTVTAPTAAELEQLVAKTFTKAPEPPPVLSLEDFRKALRESVGT